MNMINKKTISLLIIFVVVVMVLVIAAVSISGYQLFGLDLNGDYASIAYSIASYMI
ncbi:MAG: hypothetical protein LBM96_08015 [Methanobrevibacter sp.]|jgi:hypothetical protein|nr:hypothetical protein [Candidatus Methanoflexus mossambicus]